MILRTLSNAELASLAESNYPNLTREMQYELIYRLRRSAHKTVEPANAVGERVADLVRTDWAQTEQRVAAQMQTVAGRLPHVRK